MAINFTNKNISSIQINGENFNLKSVPFHATEAEWLLINYIPKQGENVVYDIDDAHNYLRFKTGDGNNLVKDLPFSLVTVSEMEKKINSQLNSAGHLKRVIIEAGEALPSIEDADVDTIYMKLAYDSLLAPNIYEEYMVINGAWEIIGNTNVDLSDYAKISDVAQKSQIKIATSDSEEFVPTLRIHKLTQEEYDQAITDGTIDENALYLTPDEEINLSGYATEEYVDNALAAIPTPDVSGQIESHNTDLNAHEDIRNLIANIKSPVNSVNSKTGAVVLTASDVGALPVDTVIPSITGLATEEYVNNAVAQKSQVQIITWGADN